MAKDLDTLISLMVEYPSSAQDLKENREMRAEMARNLRVAISPLKELGRFGDTRAQHRGLLYATMLLLAAIEILTPEGEGR